MAHLGHCSFGLGCQLCRELGRSSWHALPLCSPLSLSLSCSHAVFPQALRARNPPWARASSLTTVHPRLSADHEDLGTLDNAGVDEDDFA